MTDIGGVRMFFGAANGSARKALRQIEEPHVMVSAQSERGVPWDGIGELFVDSGGYSLMLSEGEHPPVDDYLDTVEEYEADLWAVQDYPCEPDILDRYGRTVGDHQRRTTQAAEECLTRSEGRGISGTPVCVLQGWTVDDYLSHIDTLRDSGLLTEHVGIGSVCRRNQTDTIRTIIKSVDDELSGQHKLHAFGVKNKILSDPETRDALYSADTTAWYFRNYNKRTEIDDTWQEYVHQFLEYRRRLAEIAGVLHKPRSNQSTLPGVGQ